MTGKVRRRSRRQRPDVRSSKMAYPVRVADRHLYVAGRRQHRERCPAHNS